MKHFKTLLLVAVVTLGFNTMQAQTKIGHISTDLLISLMPETKALNTEIEKLSKTYEAELKGEEAKLEAKLKRYDSEANSQTDEVNQQRSVEVQKDQQNLYQASQVAKDDITKRRNEILKPILEKAKKAIDAEVKKAEEEKPKTILKSNAVEEIISVQVDIKQQEDAVLQHQFEKVETAEEFGGNFKDFDGEDELDDHSNALEDINMKYTVRVDDTAHSVYQADFIENTTV